ncbi:MAG TPA: DinB family protein, partial [Vicinamibacterales bacterium]|nr:DinB family protein [Vicinamibacterales bacterium]
MAIDKSGASSADPGTLGVRPRGLVKDGLLADYDHEIGATRRMLERVPDDKLGWKPHERSMTLGELSTHLGSIPSWASAILNENGFDLTDNPPPPRAKTTRADILAFFDDSTRRTRAWMDLTDAQYAAPWSLKRDGHELFSVPRVAAFRTFVIHHLIHHRGQLSVY